MASADALEGAGSVGEDVHSIGEGVSHGVYSSIKSIVEKEINEYIKNRGVPPRVILVSPFIDEDFIEWVGFLAERYSSKLIIVVRGGGLKGRLRRALRALLERHGGLVECFSIDNIHFKRVIVGDTLLIKTSANLASFSDSNKEELEYIAGNSEEAKLEIIRRTFEVFSEIARSGEQCTRYLGI